MDFDYRVDKYGCEKFVPGVRIEEIDGDKANGRRLVAI